MSNELKPCPFCGTEEVSLYLRADRDTSILCRNGHLFRGCYGYLSDERKTVEAWNTRA